MRYYVAQWCHDQKGWLDIPGSMAYSKKRDADIRAKTFAYGYFCATRAILKPHGWTQSDLTNTLMPNRR